MIPGSDNARLLDALSDGEWHESLSLYGLGMVVHSRVNELRRHGYAIESRCEGRRGRDARYFYRWNRSGEAPSAAAGPSQAAALSVPAQPSEGASGALDRERVLGRVDDVPASAPFERQLDLFRDAA
ncbi:MAG: hypothetical protein ACM33U_09010 [Solirubrobacterales bacterium]|nr:hypothetical protein [Solirubrobacterales bacterium]